MKNKLSKKTKYSILLLITELMIELISVPLCLFLIFSAAGNNYSTKTEMPHFLSGNNKYIYGTEDTGSTGDVTEPEETEDPDNPDEENPPEEENPPKEKPSEKGSFENPYNAKKAINISYEDYQYFPSKSDYAKGDFNISLKGVLKGNKAYKYLKELDNNNVKPKKGYQWLVLKYEIKYKKGNIKNNFNASYLINPYSNFFTSKQKKITSFSKYKPLFGSKEFTHNIIRSSISQKETKSLWTAIMVKDDWFPIYYRICTGYTGKGENKAPVFEWFKIPK